MFISERKDPMTDSVFRKIVARAGVAAEIALPVHPSFVLWRKRCFGSQSDRGNVFAERVMTVAHTARKQKRNVLAFLTASCKASLERTAAPSLLAFDPVAV